MCRRQTQAVYAGLPSAEQMWKLFLPFSTPFWGSFVPDGRLGSSRSTDASRAAAVTFDNVAVNGALEVLARSLVEVLAVDDPHLFEESRLAALASAQQQDLHQPLHVLLLPLDTFVDVLGLSRLLLLAAGEQADGQANFKHGPGRQEIRHVRTNFIDANLMRVRAARARRRPSPFPKLRKWRRATVYRRSLNTRGRRNAVSRLKVNFSRYGHRFVNRITKTTLKKIKVNYE